MNKHTVSDLYQMQSLPLSIKIRMTQYRIREWVEHYGTDGVYIAFSGGKDSTVLLHLVREMYPNIGAVYVDTGLEYPEIREFVKQHENVDIIRPKMNFRDVIMKYGYPMIGKEVAGCVYGARRYVEKLIQRENGAEGGEVIPNYSYMADLVGIDRREDKENALYKSLIRGEIPSTDIKVPVRYLILHGKYLHKENGAETSEYSRMYNKERYKFFLEAPFEISEHCCSIMKKAPMHNYAKKTGKMPMTAQMASESRLRTTNWLKNGCNGFEMKSPISNPMSFWTEQDVLEYIYNNHIPIADVYGEVVADCGGEAPDGDTADMGIFDLGKPVFETTGCNRTGCVYCGFGCHREKSPNRWEMAEKLSNPEIIDYMMRGGAFTEKGIWKPDGRGLGFWFVIEWINVHGNLNIILPHREKYLGQYMTEDIQKYLAA
ncbi:MAG: phosphoadenosine phosphosulfate reductase family protein [Lachnospiraceae bacterium]|nr:phosphoadenosine phosphosulfate reductase family protein [Lachnospiraceae bacterium]